MTDTLGPGYTPGPRGTVHVKSTRPDRLGRKVIAAGVIPPRQISRGYLDRLQNRCEELRANMRSSARDPEALAYWTRHHGQARTRYRLALDRYTDQVRGR